MTGRWQTIAAGALLVASGCASLDDQRESGLPRIAFTQVKSAPDTFKGQTVTFGGKVLGAKRLKEGTRIEILQLPLDSSLKPTRDLGKSQGRFIAMKKEFLDPATVPSDTFITVTGDVTGSATLPLDETDYTYPVVEIKTLRVWPKEEEPPRIRPYIGPSYYWGLYWSPY